MKNRKRLLEKIGIVLFLILAGVLILAVSHSYSQSRSKVVIPLGNRDKFAYVVILIDGTRSMSDVNFETAKRVVRQKIIPAIGYNDTAVAYDIRPRFDLKNAVFGRPKTKREGAEQKPASKGRKAAKKEEQPDTKCDPPEVNGAKSEPEIVQPPNSKELERPAEILAILSRNRERSQQGEVDEDVYQLIGEAISVQKAVKEIQDKWDIQVDCLDRPEAEGSDICAALRSIKGELAGPHEDKEKWFFIVSDFEQDVGRRSFGQALDCPSPDGDGSSDVKVRLISPLESQSYDRQKIEKLWGDYLGIQNLEWQPLAAAETGPMLLRPNPVAGLEKYEVRSFGDYFWPLFKWWLGSATTIVIVFVLFWLRLKEKPAGR